MIVINGDLLVEALERIKLPKSLKRKIMKPTVRHLMKQKCGNKAFLLPDEEKFPVMDPDTCQYDCRLIFAAYLRANEWKKKRPEYKKIAKKAAELYKKLGCEKKLGVKIREY